MSELRRIADQLRRASEGGAWHGPSLRELLQDVEAGRAATRAVPGAHTIWELVLHVTTWRDVARRRLQGDWAEPSEEENWPVPPEPSERAWRQARDAMEEAGLALRAAIESASEERLDQPLAEGRDTGYVLLHGLVQHDLYHAGQIAVLRRALGVGQQL